MEKSKGGTDLEARIRNFLLRYLLDIQVEMSSFVLGSLSGEFLGEVCAKIWMLVLKAMRFDDITKVVN